MSVSESIATSSTINNLPPEILSEIFHTDMFEYDFIDPELQSSRVISVIEPSSLSAPLLFCQVCSYWRQVAIDTPSLWSSIALKDTLKMDAVILWLQRSRNYPLSFGIWLRPRILFRRSSLGSRPQWSDLLNLLCREIHRWQDVLVHVPSIKGEMRLFMDALIPSKGKSPACMLRTLEVATEGYADIMDQDTITRLSSFPHPTLRRFIWGDNEVVEMQLPKLLDGVMWGHLQELTFIKIEAQSLLAVLKACPNLSFLNVTTLVPFPDEFKAVEIPDLPVTASNLRVMHITEGEDDISEIMQYITAPRLERLIFAQYGAEPEPTKRLLGFLERSKCNLSTLDLRYLEYTLPEKRALRLLMTKAIADIPNFSLRLPTEDLQPSFPADIVKEVNETFNSRRPTYNWLVREEYLTYHHFVWGSHVLNRRYSPYPFHRKEPRSTRKPHADSTHAASTRDSLSYV